MKDGRYSDFHKWVVNRNKALAEIALIADPHKRIQEATRVELKYDKLCPLDGMPSLQRAAQIRVSAKRQIRNGEAVTLYPYQEEDIIKIQSFGGRALLAEEPGLGKTLISLYWFKRYLNQYPLLVICPASIKWNWENEIKTHLDICPITLETLNGSDLSTEGKAFIINYDIISPSQRNGKLRPGWLNSLKELGAKCVIIDEGHYLGNPSAKRTKSITSICDKVQHVLVLTGTPFTSMPASLWPILHILDRNKWGKFRPFANNYCQPRLTHWGWQFRGATNLKRLNEELQSIMVRRRKCDVLTQLPPKARFVVSVSLESPKEYQEAKTNFRSWLMRVKKEQATRALKAERLAKWEHLRQLVAEMKLGSIKEWVKNFLHNSDEKIILFGVHRKMVASLYEAFKSIAVKVDGSTSKRDRKLGFTKFIKDSSCKILVGNVDAAGIGWSALGVSNVAFVEMPWTPGQVVQAEDRVHGIGRGNEGTRSSIWFLIGKGTIEEELCRILTAKQKNLSIAIDGKKQSDDLDVMSLLEESLLKDES